MILLSTSPTGPKTRVNLEVFDSDAKPGSKPLYRFESDIDRPAESRPDWAAVYALFVLYALVQGIERDVDNGVPTLYSRGSVRQSDLSKEAISRPRPRST